MAALPAALARQIAQTIAEEIGAQARQALAAIALLDEGATVPFIARYRKEVTGGLDDTQLRTLETRLAYLRELEERRAAILSSIEEQGKLTDALRGELLAADSKSRLEDLYLPYKPRRRTRAQIAREAGLEPLADGLLQDPARVPEDFAAGFVDADKGVADARAALEGARAILIERWGEDAALLGQLRSWLESEGVLRARVIDGKQEAGAKYRDYFDHSEALSKIPSHRLLALFRARREEVIQLELEPGADPEAGNAYAEGRIALAAGIAAQGRAADAWLLQACRLAWRAKLHLHLMLDLFNQAREKAEGEAITVFGDNLKDLLLAAPAGPHVVLGLDPGIRTGCKVAVVDATGKLVATDTIYPHEPKRQWEQSLHTLKRLCEQHEVALIAIGNGTASRETDKLAAEVISACNNPKLQKIVVSEAGASVYSASETAAREFPDLDVSIRGAVSIARRLQDRWPSWSRSIPRPSAWASTSTTWTSSGWRAHSMPGSRTASTRSGWTSTPPRRRCSRACRACLRPWRRTSWAIATSTAPSGAARSCSRCRGWARRPSSSAPGSCASPMASSRWMPRRCIRKPIRWSSASSARPTAAASSRSSATPRSCAASRPSA